MRVAPENIFPGARIRLGEKFYFVIKVNAKSFYASEKTYQEFVDSYNKRLKGTTFTAFCKQNKISSYKYTDSFEIEENEFSRKAVAVENSKNVYDLDRYEKAAIIERIEYLRKKKKQIVLSSVFNFNNKKFFFLKEKEGCYFMNINGDYILCSLETDEWIKISTVYDYKEKQIPWERLSVFASKAEMIA